jgi:hypothetical protein
MQTQPNDNYYEHRITKLEILNDNVCEALIRIEKEIKEMDKKFDAKIDKLYYLVISSIVIPILMKVFHIG